MLWPLKPNDPTLKIPHMGWNVIERVAITPSCRAFQPADGLHAYFVHSYHLQATIPKTSSPPPTMVAR
jgi:glutamine amidotransferase